MCDLIENEILNSVNVFNNHFNSINFEEKNIIEIISIAFYGGVFISKSQNQIIKHIFEKYINKTIDYYSNSLVYKSKKFNLKNKLTKNNIYSKKINVTKLNINVQDIKNHIDEKLSIYDGNISYTSILKIITVYVKNKYMSNRDEYLYISNSMYKSHFKRTYTNINAEKYLQFSIITDYINDFSSILSVYGNNLITKNDITSIYEQCIKNKNETLFINNIFQFMNNKNENIDLTDFNHFVENILKNGIKTPYYYESEYNEKFEKELNHISNVINKILKPENKQILLQINNIKENIIERGIKTNNIDNEYESICNDEIIKNNLNINDFTYKTFFEYFMSTKSEAKIKMLNNLNQFI